MTSKEKPKNA